MTRFAANRDYFAGGLMALIGAGAVYEGQKYGIGSLSDMGSGYFPVVAGSGLILLGIAMASVRGPAPDGQGASAPDWRGALAITAGVVLFVNCDQGRASLRQTAARDGS